MQEGRESELLDRCGAFRRDPDALLSLHTNIGGGFFTHGFSASWTLAPLGSEEGRQAGKQEGRQKDGRLTGYCGCRCSQIETLLLAWPILALGAFCTLLAVGERERTREREAEGATPLPLALPKERGLETSGGL